MTRRITVVLASLRPRPIAEASLAALVPQCAREGVTLIVARRATDDEEDWLMERFPGCQLVRCDATAGVPEVRGAGLGAADGEWTLLTEDNCCADDDWVSRMRERATPGVGVIGGAMGNASTARSIDWGAFFAEYGFFGATDDTGAAALATGANVAYRGDLLNLVASLCLAGSWEDVIHDRLAKADIRFGNAPHAVVRQQLSYGLLSFMHDRFVHGRDYAMVRSRSLGRLHRLVLALGSVLLPAVLAFRIWKRTGRRTPGPFVRALPATLTFLLAWATGEAVGYLRGPDSDA
jgi:hypothetical protein